MKEERTDRKDRKVTITTWEKNEMRHRKGGQQSKSGRMKNEAKDSHLITGEEMNASRLGTVGKWRYNGGRGDIPEEEKERDKKRKKN
jgi:hypothetical protein